MRLTYHLMINPKALSKIAQWQTACQQWGFNVYLSPHDFTHENSVLRLSYQNHRIEITTYTSPTSDVADICDELRQHITEEQNLALNFDVNDEQEKVYGVTIALSALTKLLDGTLYIEGDSVFFTAEQALENARAINHIVS